MTQFCKSSLILFIFSILISACAAPHSDRLPAVTDADSVDAAPARDGRITLISGDVLNWSIAPSGRLALSMDELSGADERSVIFVTEQLGSESWLYPAAVRAYINTGTLDRGFFNIPAQIEQGLVYEDELPVVLVHDEGMDLAERASTVAVLPGARYDRTLDKANALAIRIDLNRMSEFWTAVTTGVEAGEFADGVTRVLLDHGEDIVPVSEQIQHHVIEDTCDLPDVALTVEGIGRDGQPAAGLDSLDSFAVLNVDDASIFTHHGFFTDGVGRVCVPPGNYSVMGVISTYDPVFGFVLPLEMAVIGDPEMEIDSDTTVVLDARVANEITFRTPQATERVDDFYRLLWWREAEQNGGISVGQTGVWPVSGVHPGQQLRRFAQETAPVTRGNFELVADTRLFLTGEGPASPILYDLVAVWHEHVPADPSYQVDTEQLAAVVNSLYSDILPEANMKELRDVWRPWQPTSVSLSRDVRVRLKRTEYLVPGDTRYRQNIDAAGVSAATGPGILSEPETFYLQGEHREQSWFKQPMRPGVREIGPGAAPVVREDDTLVLLMPEWVDTQPGHFGFRNTSVDTTAFRFLRDGELIATAPRPQGSFPMVPESAEYRLELDIERNAPWRFTSTQTRTAWTLRSENPGAGVTEIVPLMLLDYEIDLDLGNNTTPETQYLDITARYQAGSSGPSQAGERAAAPDLNVQLSVSRDDGSSWQAIPGQDLGDGRFRFDLAAVHAIGGFISLRANARDRAGNRIEQDIIRAYSVPEQIPPSPPSPPVDQ